MSGKGWGGDEWFEAICLLSGPAIVLYLLLEAIVRAAS